MIFSEYYLCLLFGMKCNQRTGRNFRLILILNFKISCRQISLKFNFVCMYYIKCNVMDTIFWLSLSIESCN